MLWKIILPVAVLVWTASAHCLAKSQSNEAAEFRFAVSPVRLIASGVSFKGEKCTYFDDIKKEIEEENRLIKISGEIFRYSMYSYPYEDGFKLYRTEAATCTNYPLGDLAEQRGWFKRGKNDSTGMPDGTTALRKIGGKLWMSSHGIGILVFDPQTGKFSRYDTQREANFKHRLHIDYADENYLISGVTIYSFRRRKWRRLISAPRRAFVQFGYTPESVRQYVQLSIDHRVYAEQPFVRLEGFFTPEQVSISADGETYFFQRSFGEFDDSKTIYKITKLELEKIFN